MFQFNTLFLFKATAISALGCLPMVYNRESGFVWTAFLLPVSLSFLVATQARKFGAHEIEFNELPDAVVEIKIINGRYGQWFTRGRIVVAGACLSLAIGFPLLHLVDPGPIALWLPLVVVFGIGAVILAGYSERLRVRSAERQIVTEYLVFGRCCWWRRRWRVREGDSLEVVVSGPTESAIAPEFRFFHMLYICRARRRHMIACLFTRDRDVPDMEVAAERIAQLIDVPYDAPRRRVAGLGL